VGDEGGGDLVEGANPLVVIWRARRVELFERFMTQALGVGHAVDGREHEHEVLHAAHTSGIAGSEQRTEGSGTPKDEGRADRVAWLTQASAPQGIPGVSLRRKGPHFETEASAVPRTPRLLVVED
jgi:hypothetical protein